MKKSIILLFTIFILFNVSSFAYAASDCGAPQKDKDGKIYYDCTCQGKSYKNCYVGGLISRPECACCGDCTLNDMIRVFTNYSQGALKFAGIFAMLFIVVGGIIWMTSGGSAEKVKKGTDIVKGAVIGLIIIFIAFVLVRMVMQALGTEKYLPTQSSTTAQTDQDWPACPVPPVSGKSWWCYGCVWTGSGRGCQADAVGIYQDELNRLGCDCGTADGKFDLQTKECTFRFQKANNLAQDGLVGLDTYKKVFETLTSDLKSCP